MEGVCQLGRKTLVVAVWLAWTRLLFLSPAGRETIFVESRVPLLPVEAADSLGVCSRASLPLK